MKSNKCSYFWFKMSDPSQKLLIYSQNGSCYNVNANHIEFLLNARTCISTVQNRGRDGTLDLGWDAAFNTIPWDWRKSEVNSWGDGRITHLRPIVGRNDVIAHLFRTRLWAKRRHRPSWRKLWTNARKQNSVVQNLNLTLDQHWKYLFQTCKHENDVLNIIKLRVYYS